MPLSGIAIAEVGAGGLLVYSGIKGYTMADTVQSLLKGTAPSATETINQDSYGTVATTAATSGTSSSSSAAAGDTGASSASAAANQATAKQILTQMGLSSWTTGTEWDDLVSLWNQESGWSATAQNPTSTAYGIAQFLDSTWATVGATKTSDPAAQITAGIEYIEQRYGSPAMAWAHETENSWY